MKKIARLACAGVVFASAVHAAGEAQSVVGERQRIAADAREYTVSIWHGGEEPAVIFANHTDVAVELRLGEAVEAVIVSANGALRFACDGAQPGYFWLADAAQTFHEVVTFQCGDAIALRGREVSQ